MLSFILSLCRILQLLTPFTLALTLPPTRDITNPSQSVPPINKTLPGPAALILESELASNYSSYAQNANPVCDGGLLGFDVNRYSCLQAWNMIPNDPQQLTFGDRLSGTFDVQLPRRFSGPDATCVIDVFHKDGVISDKASYQQISRAAEHLYGDCVSRGQRTQGGWIRDIGASQNLVIVLSMYNPTVACFGPRYSMRIPLEPQQNLLSQIPVSTEQQTFGAEGEPGVQVVVPVTYSVPPNPGLSSPGLRLTIDVQHRNPVKARWFDVWAGGVSVAAMCMDRRYDGVSGLSTGLTVALVAVLGPRVGNETASS